MTVMYEVLTLFVSKCALLVNVCGSHFVLLFSTWIPSHVTWKLESCDLDSGGHYEWGHYAAR